MKRSGFFDRITGLFATKARRYEECLTAEVAGLKGIDYRLLMIDYLEDF